MTLASTADRHARSVARVAASEYDILSVARAIAGDLGPMAVRQLLGRPRTLPAKLGSTAIALLGETLAKGLVLQLCRRGGWRRAEHLGGDDTINTGRLWERHAPQALHLSPLAVALCRWLVERPLRDGASCPRLDEPGGKPPKGPPFFGDELLLYLACDLAVEAGYGAALGAAAAVRRSPLCWLGFADLLAPTGEPPSHADDGWAALCRPPGAVVLEALQADLARRWRAIERGRRRLMEPELLESLGEAQAAAAAALCEAAERAGRLDLALFLIEGLAPQLREGTSATSWLAKLPASTSLAHRQAAAHASALPLDGLLRLHGGITAASAARFFDEGYERGQLLLRAWETLGPGAHQRAAELAAALRSPTAFAPGADDSAPARATDEQPQKHQDDEP